MSAVSRSNSCPSTSFSVSLPKPNFSLLEKVSNVALSAFATYVNSRLFLAFFAIGAGIGLVEGFLGHNLDSNYDDKREFSLINLVALVVEQAIPALLITNLPKIFVPIDAMCAGLQPGYFLAKLIVRHP